MKGYRKLVDKIMEPDDFETAACRGLPCMRMASDSAVYIDGHRGIIEYDRSVIKLNAKGRKIILKGENMYIAAFSKDFIKIRGKIQEVSFERLSK